MIDFWLATFQMTGAMDDSMAGPIVAAGARYLAIEVLRENNDWAVLFSSVDDARQPTSLTCLIGFTNAAKACNVWLDRGFPLVDAAISMTAAGGLSIVSPFFVDRQSVMRYETQLLSLTGVLGPNAAVGKSPPNGSLAACYDQHLQVPDAAQPDVFTSRTPVTWTPQRLKVRKMTAQYVSQIDLNFGPAPSRNPSLAPLQSGQMTPLAAWAGEIRLPDKKKVRLGTRLDPQKVTHAFGVPAFRFEDVEVLGFRIDLAELGGDVRKQLAQLVKPLNFHLAEQTSDNPWRPPIADFRYRAATPTLVIELLRYGRMKARVPRPPMGADDSQSQHELVVRMVVGRVDDDSAQAHAPAVYVPAIFVDNPWSKILGRDAIGFDKRLADFCVIRDDQQERLLPDGRRTKPAKAADTWKVEPLGDIRHINLVGRTGTGDGKPLLDLRFSSNDHTDPEALEPIDLDLAFGTSMLAGARWRQSDFDDAEFRRSFANVAVAESVRAFRSIQVAPVVARGNLGQTWITGTFVVDPGIRARWDPLESTCRHASLSIL